MSTIIITSPYEDCNICATCLQLQLSWFRNQIKEQWNRFNNDGKLGIVRIPLEINPMYPMEMAATMVNGNLTCVTHMLISLNNVIEASNRPKSRLDVAPGPLDGLKNAKRMGA